jgi:hypothetical protein
MDLSICWLYTVWMWLGEEPLPPARLRIPRISYLAHFVARSQDSEVLVAKILRNHHLATDGPFHNFHSGDDSSNLGAALTVKRRVTRFLLGWGCIAVKRAFCGVGLAQFPRGSYGGTRRPLPKRKEILS